MKDRITVQEAARRLGVKDDAIRKRIQRGTLDHEKDPDGRVFVYLDATHDAASDAYKDSTRYSYRDKSEARYQDDVPDPAEDAAHATQDSSYAAIMESMVAQIDRLETEVDDWKQVVATRDEEIRRRDAILLTMAQRLPELEPPAEESAETSLELRDSSETASPRSDRGVFRDETQEPARRSWWRRLFGFEA